MLRAMWTDPDFNPNHSAVDYAWVLEIPTPAWHPHDAKFSGTTMPEQGPPIHQERAYTSPIWYTPGKRKQPICRLQLCDHLLGWIRADMEGRSGRQRPQGS